LSPVKFATTESVDTRRQISINRRGVKKLK